MPVIKVWCLPKLSERNLNKVHRWVVSAVESVPELGLKSEKSMTILFPTDMMKYGLGTEIIIEVAGLFVNQERTNKVRERLAQAIGTAIKEFFPRAMVKCFVYSFDPAQGFWESPEMDYGPGLNPEQFGFCSDKRAHD